MVLHQNDLLKYWFISIVHLSDLWTQTYWCKRRELCHNWIGHGPKRSQQQNIPVQGKGLTATSNLYSLPFKTVTCLCVVQDGVMVPFTVEESESLKHSLKQVGKKYVFTIKNLGKDDAGLYSVDVEGVNVFSTEFKGTSSVGLWGINQFNVNYIL